MANKYTGDREQLLERIAEAVEAFTGSTPDNTSDRQNATGLAPERIAEALENGGGGSSGGSSNLVIETYDETTNTYILNKTWREITDMLANGLVAIRASVEEGQTQTYLVGGTLVYNEQYSVYTAAFWEDGIDSTYTYSCQNENAYPSCEK